MPFALSYTECDVDVSRPQSIQEVFDELYDRIQEAVQNGRRGSLEALDEHLAVVNALLALAAHKQQNGGRLSDDQIAFLEALNAELSDPATVGERLHGEESTSGDYLGFLRALEDGEHLSDQRREEVKSSLSGALPAVSDEKIGGGYEHVPEEVRAVIEGPDHGDLRSGHGWMVTYKEWEEDITLVSAFLGSTDDETHEDSKEKIQGGMELSVNLTAMVAESLPRIESPHIHTPEEIFQNILEIATRNKDANYTILTGDFPNDTEYGLPWGDENKKTPSDTRS